MTTYVHINDVRYQNPNIVASHYYNQYDTTDTFVLIADRSPNCEAQIKKDAGKYTCKPSTYMYYEIF